MDRRRTVPNNRFGHGLRCTTTQALALRRRNPNSPTADLLGFFEPAIPVERLDWGELDCAA